MTPARGQDSLTMDGLLRRISAEQVRDQGFFYPGMFPCMRAWAATPRRRVADNSIFFTGLVAFTLKSAGFDSIVRFAAGAYIHYANRDGKPTFNFWPTDRKVFFPNSRLLHHYEDSKSLADDLDDTSVLWLSQDLPDSTATRLKELMDRHANLVRKRVRNSYRRARTFPAYSAWFGTRTPIEFDAGVLCNVLYFVRAAGLSWDRADSGSVAFLRFILEKRKYWTDPAFASSYYPRTPVLIYHFARLMGKFRFPGLEPYRPQLIRDARYALSDCRDPMDKVILQTALLRLGDTAVLSLPLPVHSAGEAESDPFVFYIANLSCLFPNPFRRVLLQNPLWTYHFFCPAYNDALVLENLSLRLSLAAKKSSTPTP